MRTSKIQGCSTWFSKKWDSPYVPHLIPLKKIIHFSVFISIITLKYELQKVCILPGESQDPGILSLKFITSLFDFPFISPMRVPLRAHRVVIALSALFLLHWYWFFWPPKTSGTYLNEEEDDGNDEAFFLAKKRFCTFCETVQTFSSWEIYVTPIWVFVI